MKTTVTEKKGSAHVNPTICPGNFYIIRGLRKPWLSDSSKVGTVFMAGFGMADAKIHYFDVERITHSPYSYANESYDFEKLVGTVTIECP